MFSCEFFHAAALLFFSLVCAVEFECQTPSTLSNDSNHTIFTDFKVCNQRVSATELNLQILALFADKFASMQTLIVQFDESDSVLMIHGNCSCAQWYIEKTMQHEGILSANLSDYNARNGDNVRTHVTINSNDLRVDVDRVSIVPDAANFVVQIAAARNQSWASKSTVRRSQSMIFRKSRTQSVQSPSYSPCLGL